MKLEINKKDQSINAETIKKTKNIFKRSIAGILASITLFSGSIIGSFKAKAANNDNDITYSNSQTIDENNPSKVIDIPECYRYEVTHACGKNIDDPITIYDLNNIKDKYLSIVIQSDESLEWLNYVKGVTNLTLIIKTNNLTALKNIEKIDDLESLMIIGFDEIIFEMEPENFKFLIESKQIKNLNLYNFISAPGFLESLTHLKKLGINNDDGNYILNFKQLTFLDELTFLTGNPYDIAIYFTKDEYKVLTDAGVKIDFGNEETKQLYFNIDEKLNNIISSLGLTEESSDLEKLDAILIYVLDNLTYDEAVKQAVYNGLDYNPLAKEFYINGALYGALEKNTAICGNYAALTNALAERLKLNSYYLTSPSHAWSLIEIEGELYYVDATWLDGKNVYVEREEIITDEFGFQIGIQYIFEPVDAATILKNNGDKSNLEWYLEDPTSYPKSNDQKESHVTNNLPKFYKLYPQEEVIEENTTTSEETIKPTEENTTTSEETIEPTEENTIITEETNKQTECYENITESTNNTENEPINLDNDKVAIQINGKKYIVPAAVAIGILSGIGAAVHIKKKKKRKEKERQERLQQLYYSDEYNPYYSAYNTDDTYQNSGKRY